MEEPKSQNSANDVGPLHLSSASSGKQHSDSEKNRGREKNRFKIPAMVMKDELPLPSETARLFDPVARSLRLNDKKVTGKQFAFYNTGATRNLINGKWIVFIGGSVVRAMYKDLVHMVNNATSLVYPYDLARKGEISFEHDQLLFGDKLFNRELANGIEYEEVRTFVPRFQDCRGMISFCFVTRFWNDNLRRTLESEFFHPRQQFGNPDVVFANSCLWDLARYGSYRTEEEMLSRYRESVEEFVNRFEKLSSNRTLLVIMSTLPVSTHCSGAFLMDGHNSGLKTSLWKDIRKANVVCADVVKKRAENGQYIVYLDLYTLVKNLDLSPWMEHDGTHWNPPAHRIFSYAVLSFMQRTCYGSLLPAESFDTYLGACDDLFRFNEYRRWLAMRILKKSNKTLEAVMQAIDERHSKKATEMESGPRNRYSHTNGQRGTENLQLAAPYSTSAVLPERPHHYVSDPVTHGPKVIFDDVKLRGDLERTATRFRKKARLAEPPSQARCPESPAQNSCGAEQWEEATRHWNVINIQLPRAEQWEEASRHWNDMTKQPKPKQEFTETRMAEPVRLVPVPPNPPPPPPPRATKKPPPPPRLPQPPPPSKPMHFRDFASDDYEMPAVSQEVLNDHDQKGFVTSTGWLTSPNLALESIPLPPGHTDYSAVNWRY